MQSKMFPRWSLVLFVAIPIVCGTMIVLGVWRLRRLSPATTITPVEAAMDPVTATATYPGLPSRIIIPKIGVNATLEHLGITPSGAMAVTKGPTDAAWFDLGPVPGEIGSAVIAGHDGWKDNIPAVFDDLYELRPGDLIYIVGDRGTTVKFVVRAVQLYGQNANAATVFTSSDGKAHLNLITCEGIWNAAEKSYSNRLVVFADEEAQ